MIYSLKELLNHAREFSPYYRELYKNIGQQEYDLTRFPVTNQSTLWQANTVKENRLLTAELGDAIVFKSGGTTGQPKFSIYTRDEWRAFTKLFGEGMSAAAISPKDRVANLFYAGDLYASFLFIHESLEQALKPSVNFPVSGTVHSQTLAHLIEEFSLNVLAGVPTTLIGFAEEFEQAKQQFEQVEKILFGGESLYPEQAKFLEKVFPNAKCFSIGYASVDGGLLGFADESCGPDEHRPFDQATVMEIVDETTGDIVTEINKTGKLLVTNLTRLLMPIIRYPTGDRAMWLAPGKFKLMGRSEEAARVGPASIYYDDIRNLLEEIAPQAEHRSFQILTQRKNGKDQLVLRICGADSKPDSSESTRILTELTKARPMLAELVETGKVEAPDIQWVQPIELERNARTGKLKRIIDLRPH